MNKFDEKNNNINNINDQEKTEINQEQETLNVQDAAVTEKQDASEKTEAKEENTGTANAKIAESHSKGNEKSKSNNNKKKEPFISRVVKDRSFRYGSNSLILIVAVCAIAVLVNVLVGFTDVKWDLTPDKL